MQFAPAGKVHFVDPMTGYQVRSDPKPKRTDVLDPDGNTLWSMPLFTEHDRIDLSPDGQYLVTSGTSLIRVPDDTLATVYCNGVAVRSIWFSDCFAKSGEELCDEREIAVMGGGWTQRDHFVTLAVDWAALALRFTLYTGELKSFGLERDEAPEATEQALIDQLVAQPFDLTARGVFADWLEQNGFATRARLMRSNARIESCESTSCPKTWSALGHTARDHVRSCSACDRLVFHCATENEIRWRTRTQVPMVIDLLDRAPAYPKHRGPPPGVRAATAPGSTSSTSTTISYPRGDPPGPTSSLVGCSPNNRSCVAAS